MTRKSVYKPVQVAKANTAESDREMIDDVICKILNIELSTVNIMRYVPFEKVMRLLDMAKPLYKAQGALLYLDAPVKICGDVHGQYADVLRLFDRGGFPPVVNYLFLGDYVDRGPHSCEVVTLFIAYKLKFPGNFFTLRGNHECGAINRVYGFLDEICRKYGSKNGGELWGKFQEIFGNMPASALVSGKILCMHGGISNQLRCLGDLEKIPRPTLDPQAGTLEMDILWSDPDHYVAGFDDSTRGVGQVFGEQALDEIMKKLNIDLVARAHQVVQDGYEFFSRKRLVTIFSAPHYCGEFDNAAAMMNVDKNLMCSFQIMRPIIKEPSRKETKEK